MSTHPSSKARHLPSRRKSAPHPPRSNTGSDPLSLYESLRLCGIYFRAGVKDAFAFGRGLLTIFSSKKIQIATLKCVVLNGVIFLGSIVLFDQVIIRVLHFLMSKDLIAFLKHRGSENYAEATTTTPWTKWATDAVDMALWWVYNVLWIYPIYCISFILNTIWYQEIADRSYVLQVGSPVQMKATYSSVVNTLITNLYRSLLIFNLFLLATVIYFLPLIGPLLSFIYVAWIYAFYSFEYKWVNRGWSLEDRCNYFEERWCYFGGFGFPFALFTFFFPQMISGGIFALLFPMYIIMANAAIPYPRPGTNSAPLPNFHSLIPLRMPLFKLPKRMSAWMINFVKPKIWEENGSDVCSD